MPPHRGRYPSPGELGVRKDARRAGGSYLVGDSTEFSHQSVRGGRRVRAFTFPMSAKCVSASDHRCGGLG